MFNVRHLSCICCEDCTHVPELMETNTLGSICSSAVGHMPRGKEVVGSIPARCWAFYIYKEIEQVILLLPGSKCLPLLSLYWHSDYINKWWVNQKGWEGAQVIKSKWKQTNTYASQLCATLLGNLRVPRSWSRPEGGGDREASLLLTKGKLEFKLKIPEHIAAHLIDFRQESTIMVWAAYIKQEIILFTNKVFKFLSQVMLMYSQANKNLKALKLGWNSSFSWRPITSSASLSPWTKDDRPKPFRTLFKQ